MEETTLSLLFISLLSGFAIALLFMFIYQQICFYKYCNRCGVFITNILDKNNCVTLAEILTRFISDNTSVKGLSEFMRLDCTGLCILRESKDVSKLIDMIHGTGGRLVLRRVSDTDIENEKNTVLEVKKILTEMDIKRYRVVKKKNKLII